jgi:predicted deacylase
MARRAIEVGGVRVQPGESKFGFLHIAYLAAKTEVRVPFQVLHGADDGPTVCLEATLHGWEPMGAEVLRRALLRVNPKTLRGTILNIPLANPMSVEIGGGIEGAGQRINPADHLDLNRVWPGKSENAWLTERIADVLWREVVSRCQYLIDYHDGTGSSEELPVTFATVFPTDTTAAVRAEGADGVGAAPAAVLTGIPLEKMKAMNEKIRDLAIAWGSTVISWRERPVNPAMILGSAMLNNIVPLYVETGGAHTIDWTIDASVDCTLNLLKHLRMIEGNLVLPKRQIMVNNYIIARSRTGGFYQVNEDVKLGSEIKKGTVIGTVVDPLTSEVLEEYRSPVNAVVVSRRVRMPINPGGYVAHLADTDAIIWERTNA